jgi:Uma2 family endonuclease
MAQVVILPFSNNVAATRKATHMSLTSLRPAALRPAARVRDADPTWEIAHLFPAQGTWSEEEYLGLPGNRLVEFSDGFLEVLPMPTMSHQELVVYLYGLLFSHVSPPDLGKVLLAPLRVRLWPGKFREPDLVFMLKRHYRRMGEEFWDRADLVMEVVSGDPDDRRRDLVIKRREYARARIPEYWIIDPHQGAITVLRLAGGRYTVYGSFGSGSQACSHLLPGFVVDVTAAFAAATAAASQGRNARRPRR